MTLHIYECPECGDEYLEFETGVFYCDWIDCEHDEPLTYIGQEE